MSSEPVRERIRNARASRRRQAGPQLPRCEQYVDAYLADYARRNRPSSLETEARRLRRFREDFKGRRLDISRAEIKQWLHGEGPWSQRGPIPKWEVVAITSLYNHAIDVDDLPLARNPARGLRPPTRMQAAPTPAEFDSLLSACSSLDEYGAMMRAAVRFGAYSLISPSELYALRWSDIDFRRMRIHARSGTRDPEQRVRLIALTPAASQAIRPLPRDPGPVFRSKTGRPLTSPTFLAYWRAVLAAAGLRFGFHHAIKHHGVHYMWSVLGLSPRAIAAQAGWKLETANRLLGACGHGEAGGLRGVDSAFLASPSPLR